MADNPNSTDQSRRKFLEKVAIYTPPTIMLLMYPRRHAVAYGEVTPPPLPPPPPPPPTT
jgi:hypothetical protein